MDTEIYESDRFSTQKGRRLAKLATEYRFEKNDELFVETEGRSVKIRVMHVRGMVHNGTLSRKILGLKL